jgi:hypothetical protein
MEIAIRDGSEGIYSKIGIIGCRWLLGRVQASRFLCAVGPRNLREKTGVQGKLGTNVFRSYLTNAHAHAHS